MRDYSLVILVGRVTKDPELKYSADGGTPSVDLHMSIRRQTTDADGSLSQKVSFVRAIVRKHQAEIACQFLKKGSSVMVVGQLIAEKDKVLTIAADRIQFLDKKIETGVPIAGDKEQHADDHA